MQFFEVNYGLSVLNPKSTVRVTDMARRGSLADLMQRGIVKSAWGDNDTPDWVGLSGKESTVTGGHHLNPKYTERLRLEKERRDEERRQELERQRLISLAQEAERKAAEARELKRLEKIAERELAQEELESLDGFGLF